MTMNDGAPERAGNAIVRLGSFWMISAEPHVMMRLKRLWGGIAKETRGELRIKRSPAVDFEVRWMLDGPWEFEISASDRIDLHRGAEEHTRSQKRVLTILDGKAPPLDVEMGVTPRDYQLVAAAWWKETKRSILADTLGTGKTISALTALADPKLRPAAIVCETHLAIQWAGEIRRAFPGARAHIIKQGTPYDVIAATRREEQRAGKPMGTGWPEFVVLNYHKLDGWASTLSKNGLASLVYDECVTADTLVTMWDGPAKPIVDVRPGDVVAAFGPDGSIVPDRVISVVAKGRRKVWRMLVHGGYTLTCTNNERIWTNHGWLYLQDILDVAKRNGSTDSFIAVGNAARDRFGTRGRVDHPREPARSSGLRAFDEAGGLLPHEGGDAGALRPDLAEGHGEPGMGAECLHLPHGDYAGLRLLTFGGAPAGPTDGSACSRGHSGASGVAGLAGGSDLVHGRRGLLTERSHGIPAHGALHPRGKRDAGGVVLGAGNAPVGRHREDSRQKGVEPTISRARDEAADRQDFGVQASGRGVQVRRPDDGVPAVLPVRQPHSAEAGRGIQDGPVQPGVSSRIRQGVPPGALPGPNAAGVYADLIGIEYIGEEDVWDLETESLHTFFANGIGVHNCQALRHNETKRYAGAVLLAATVPYILGMSATPVWNYGGAIINIVDVIRPGFLGERDEFYREWCGEGEERKKLILDQRAFGRHLRESGFMLRRTREEVGRELPALTIAPTLIDTDGPQLDTDRMTLRRLAETILTRQTGPQAGLTAMQAARDFDVKLRKITGAAKAPAVADLARMMVESGEKVVIGAWHREVWDLLALRLKDYSPAFITGHETPKQKNESKRRLLDGETPILGVSLASCAGLDGLQHVCATGILAELAWTPKIHEQLFGRLHRDGQKRPVTWTVAYANWGSDPIVMDVCGVKDAQSRPIVDPDAVIADFQADPEHVKRLARDFLERHR